MSGVANKLREARKLIERGWTQSAYSDRYSDRECVCALGAIGQAIKGNADCDGYWYDGELGDAVHLLAAIVGSDEAAPLAVVQWNDAPERTQTEVLAAFDKAIELAEREDAR